MSCCGGGCNSQNQEVNEAVAEMGTAHLLSPKLVELTKIIQNTKHAMENTFITEITEAINLLVDTGRGAVKDVTLKMYPASNDCIKLYGKEYYYNVIRMVYADGEEACPISLTLLFTENNKYEYIIITTGTMERYVIKYKQKGLASPDIQKLIKGLEVL